MSIAGAREHLRKANEALIGSGSAATYPDEAREVRGLIQLALTELSGPLPEDIAAEYNECLCARLGVSAVPVTAEERERAKATVLP